MNLFILSYCRHQSKNNQQNDFSMFRHSPTISTVIFFVSSISLPIYIINKHIDINKLSNFNIGQETLNFTFKYY